MKRPPKVPWMSFCAIFCGVVIGRSNGLSQEPKPAPATPASPAQVGAQPAAKPVLPEGVLARVNGRDITIDDYVGYLFASLGRSRLDGFVDRLLVEEEAKAAGVTILPERVESALEERLDRTIKGLYQGSKEKFAESLSKRRSTLDEHKAKLRQELYYELLGSDVILKSRQVTDADILRQFEKAFGEGGTQHTIRQILVSGSAAGAGTDVSPQRPSKEAREKAEKILKELEGGLDFTQAVKQHSDDTFTKKNDGRIPSYRKGFYGEAFHSAVVQLTPEKPLSGVVESPRGFHIIQLVEKKITKLENVKSEVEKLVKSQAPTAKERHELISKLRGKAKLEGL